MYLFKNKFLHLLYTVHIKYSVLKSLNNPSLGTSKEILIFINRFVIIDLSPTKKKSSMLTKTLFTHRQNPNCNPLIPYTLYH